MFHAIFIRFNRETLVDILARLGTSIDLTVTRVQPYARWQFSPLRPNWRPHPHMAYG